MQLFLSNRELSQQTVLDLIFRKSFTLLELVVPDADSDAQLNPLVHDQHLGGHQVPMVLLQRVDVSQSVHHTVADHLQDVLRQSPNRLQQVLP